jgi:predicted metal-dependent phosphoesterase TrpH
MCTVPVLSRVCRESYNETLEVYECLKRRGMDMDTATDHDSIESAEALRRFPNFFVSEEVSRVTPARCGVHVGVYDITERDHVEIQLRRTNIESLAASLNERNILFAVNHLFSALTGARHETDFELVRDLFPAMETLNGPLMPPCNQSARRLARLWRKIGLAGSDAHTIETVGLTFTEVPGARSLCEFVQGLKQSRARTRGHSGTYAKLTRAVWSIGANMVRNNHWMCAAAPPALAVPLVTVGSCARDLLFARMWSRRSCLEGFPAYPLRQTEDEI